MTKDPVSLFFRLKQEAECAGDFCQAFEMDDGGHVLVSFQDTEVCRRVTRCVVVDEHWKPVREDLSHPYAKRVQNELNKPVIL